MTIENDSITYMGKGVWSFLLSETEGVEYKKQH